MTPEEANDAWFIIEGLLRIVKSIKSTIGTTKQVDDLIVRAQDWLDDTK